MRIIVPRPERRDRKEPVHGCVWNKDRCKPPLSFEKRNLFPNQLYRIRIFLLTCLHNVFFFYSGQAFISVIFVHINAASVSRVALVVYMWGELIAADMELCLAPLALNSLTVDTVFWTALLATENRGIVNHNPHRRVRKELVKIKNAVLQKRCMTAVDEWRCGMIISISEGDTKHFWDQRKL